MKTLKRSLVCMVFGMLLLLCLAGCAKDETAASSIPQWPWEQKNAEQLTVTVTEADFELLEKCENLRYLDLSGSTCYDAILAYMEAHPQVEVIYTVPVGGTVVTNTQTDITLNAEDGTYSRLAEALPYLPEVKNIHLPKTMLRQEELDSIRDAYPGIEITYSLNLLGREYSHDTAEVDLSALTPGEFDAVTAQMAMLPNVKTAELMTAAGSSQLSLTDVKALMDAFPKVSFRYSFELFGQTLSTETERVEYVNQNIGNEGAGQIRQALAIMPKCTYFKADSCGIDSEILGSIQEEFPDTKIVWRVRFGQYEVMTDAEMIRAVYHVYDEDVANLKYCTNVKYIDMGHNSYLTDLSFVQYMPDLEIMIGSGSSVSDISAFANCKKLEFLELAYCYSLADISALKECESLRFLNLSFTKVSDLSPLDDLKLERFVCLSTNVPHDTRAPFEELHPDCWTRFTGQNPYSLGWRYDDIGITFSAYYLHVREVFGYDEVDDRLAQQKAREEAAQQATQSTEAPADTAPPATEAPVATTPPTTEVPAPTAPPATEAPAPTTPLATEAPVVTEPPVTQAPVPEAPPAPEG